MPLAMKCQINNEKRRDSETQHRSGLHAENFGRFCAGVFEAGSFLKKTLTALRRK